MGGSASKPNHNNNNNNNRIKKSPSGGSKSAWDNGNHHKQQQQQPPQRRRKPVKNRLVDSETEEFGRTSYNLLDLHGYGNHKSVDPYNDKFAAFSGGRRRSDTPRMEYSPNLPSRRRHSRSPSPQKRFESSPSPPPSKKPATPQHHKKQQSPVKRQQQHRQRSPEKRRVSDVSSIDLSPPPSHFKQPPPKFSHSLNNPKSSQKQPPQRRARSISPPQQQQHRKSNKTKPGGAKKPASFTNLSSVRSASQSMNSAASAKSNYEQRTRVEAFADKRDTLESAGLARVTVLNNRIKDQKVAGVATYEQAKKNMDAEDWEPQVKGIEMIVSLARDKPDILRNDIKTLIKYMMEGLKNLRSQVCRAAGQAFGELFFHLGKAMEVDLEKTVALLLQKAADTNKFIRESCAEALDVMLENVTLLRALQATTEFGANHKSAVIRASVARLLDKAVTQLGCERVMGCSKELQELVMKSGSKFLQDSGPEVRKYARHMFTELVKHKKFDALQQQTLKEAERRDIKKTLEAL